MRYRYLWGSKYMKIIYKVSVKFYDVEHAHDRIINFYVDRLSQIQKGFWLNEELNYSENATNGRWWIPRHKVLLVFKTYTD